MGYMKDLFGRRLDTFEVPEKTRRKLKQWNIGQAHTAGFAAISVGDSVTEGTRGADAPYLRYIDHLADGLRRIGNPTGVKGGIHIPANGFYGTRLPAQWQFTGTVTLRAVYGIGLWNAELGPGATATLTLPGTGFQVLWGRGPTGGNASVTIDGVSQTAINTNGTLANGLSTSYGGLTEGSHTIVLTNTSGVGTAVNLHGGYVYNGDESTGLRVYNGGHGGLDSGQVLTNVQFEFWFQQVAADLVTIYLGINDYRNNKTSAYLKASLLTGIASIRSRRANATIVLISSYEPVHSTTPIEPWANYVAAIKEAAALTTNCILVDLAETFGTGQPPTTGGIMNVDHVHPDDAGHRLIATTILDAIVEKGALSLPRNIPQSAVVGLPAAIATKQPTLNQLVLSRPLWDSIAGSPSGVAVGGGATNTRTAAWALDPTSNEAISAGPVAIPEGWNTVNVTVVWAPFSATAGDVVWNLHRRGPVAVAGNPVSTATTTTATGTTAAAIAFRYTTVATAVAMTGGTAWNLILERDAAAGGDTLAVDAVVFSVILEKAS